MVLHILTEKQHSNEGRAQVSQGSLNKNFSSEEKEKSSPCSSDLKNWLTFLTLLPFQAPVLPLLCRGELCDQKHFFAISVNAHIYSGPLKQPMAFRIRVIRV